MVYVFLGLIIICYFLLYWVAAIFLTLLLNLVVRLLSQNAFLKVRFPQLNPIVRGIAFVCAALPLLSLLVARRSVHAFGARILLLHYCVCLIALQVSRLLRTGLKSYHRVFLINSCLTALHLAAYWLQKGSILNDLSVETRAW